MGLIQTAIMTGGGMYAVNKIAKTVERRDNNKTGYNYPRGNLYPPQGYYGPPPTPFQEPSQHHAVWDEAYGEYQDDRDQQDYYPKREYAPRRDYYPRNGMTGAQPAGYSFPTNGDYDGRYLQPSEYDYQPVYARQSENPPAYSPRPQYAQRQIQNSEQPQRQQGPSSLRDVAIGMAMDFAGNSGKSKSGKKDKGSKGNELLSEFFR